MMKIDAMTGFALAFAGFAVFQFTRPAPASTRQATGSDTAYGMARRQRDEVGAATGQNGAGLNVFDGTGAWAQKDPNSSNFFDGTGPWRL